MKLFENLLYGNFYRSREIIDVKISNPRRLSKLILINIINNIIEEYELG